MPRFNKKCNTNNGNNSARDILQDDSLLNMQFLCMLGKKDPWYRHRKEIQWLHGDPEIKYLLANPQRASDKTQDNILSPQKKK